MFLTGAHQRRNNNYYCVKLCFFFLQFFFVLKGKVLFIVGRQEFDLAAESQIRIPAGVNYAVKNVHRGLARLYYYSHQIHK